jgi:hypothetical protein
MNSLHTMASEDSPDGKKRKVNVEEEEVVVVPVVVNTKDKEEGAAREPSFVAFASAVSTQAAAAGLSLLSGGAPYNHYVCSQCKCSYRMHLCILSSHILPMVTVQPPLFLLPQCRPWFCR